MSIRKIEVKHDVCNGKPVLVGTRITVETVLSHLSAGDSITDVLEAFPQLTREHVLACLEYATRLSAVHSSVRLAS